MYFDCLAVLDVPLAEGVFGVHAEHVDGVLDFEAEAVLVGKGKGVKS